jgi:hypothetical protein
VKFELRDSYAIFLHDTPAKAAFDLATRQRSHGCVRVQGAVEFARLLLSPDPERLAEFDTAQQTRETQRIQTGREITVRLLYWTAFVDGQGAWPSARTSTSATRSWPRPSASPSTCRCRSMTAPPSPTTSDRRV